MALGQGNNTSKSAKAEQMSVGVKIAVLRVKTTRQEGATFARNTLPKMTDEPGA
jgi:hypothetical protein